MSVLRLSACCKVYQFLVSLPNRIIRVCHKCEDGIEIPVPRITVWHYEARRVITKGDPEGRISYPILIQKVSMLRKYHNHIIICLELDGWGVDMCMPGQHNVISGNKNK